MATKVDDIMYAIITNGGIQRIGEVDKKTGAVLNPNIEKLTTMCYEHIIDSYLLRDILEYELRQEPHEDMFKAVAEFLVKRFDLRMKRTVHKGRISPMSSSDRTAKEDVKHAD